MIDSLKYDGSGKLSAALARLCGLSPKSQAQIAVLIRQAKDGIGVVSKSKNLPDDVKLAIWRWHYDRLHAVKIVSQSTDGESVELYSQAVQGETVEIVSQAESVELCSHYGINALVRIAFYVVKKGIKVRQVIALDGFYINALMVATGIDKKDVPKWIQRAIENWGAFDSGLPITRQVKFLIIRELTAQLERLIKQ